MKKLYKFHELPESMQNMISKGEGWNGESYSNKDGITIILSQPKDQDTCSYQIVNDNGSVDKDVEDVDNEEEEDQTEVKATKANPKTTKAK